MAYYGEAVIAGMFFGIMAIVLMYHFLQRIEHVKFKTYLLERDDTTRDLINTMLEDILETYDKIVDKTNTMTFKRKANELRDLVNFLNKYKTNNN